MKLPARKSLNSSIVKLLYWKKRFNDSAIQRFNKAFSLIELLVVISIIGILVAAATVSWTNAQQKSRDSKRKSDLKAIQQALELYFQENGTYPEADASGLIKCPSLPGIQWGNNFQCEAVTYINPLPKDPINSSSGTTVHTYYYKSLNEVSPNVFLGYEISAGLENAKDPDFCASGGPPCSPDPLPCEPEGGRNYCQKNP